MPIWMIDINYQEGLRIKKTKENLSGHHHVQLLWQKIEKQKWKHQKSGWKSKSKIKASEVHAA